jgi:mannitol/fructose-specific phosphotransferase system IIA component
MIDYIVFPIADIGKEESAKIEELNLVLRKNRANDKALMKCQHFQEVFPNKVENG